MPRSAATAGTTRSHRPPPVDGERPATVAVNHGSATLEHPGAGNGTVD